MYCYAATIFTSAFLLFQVQPMVARFILPWFGGTSLVWTTCLLFFQVALVAGYAWSHLITRHLRPRNQWIIHSLLLIAALLTLPVRPDDQWKPVDGHYPTFRVLMVLLVSVGLPYFLVSTTSPLMQYWQSVTHPDRSPFRLFALGNAASLLALLTYPLLYERFMTLDAQSWSWSAGFALFAVLACWSGYRFWRTADGKSAAMTTAGAAAKSSRSHEAEAGTAPQMTAIRIGLWMVLPGLASIILLSTTSLMTQEVGAIPFLWVLPLSLYLLSFIICFDHNRWYVRLVFFPLFFGAALFSAIVQQLGTDAPIAIQVAGYSAICFGASMCCHGELARLKPSPRHLTLFYLLISIGGALGGAFVAIVAPRIFDNYYEFSLGLVITVMVTVFAYGYQVRLADRMSRATVLNLASFGLVLFLGILTTGFAWLACARMMDKDQGETVLVQTRNEYGTLTVKDYDSERRLNNGRIEHGMQFKEAPWSRMITTYYGESSGLGYAMRYMRELRHDENRDLSVGTIGLGVGTMCAWVESGDYLCYYEINPRVVEIAQQYFTYLRDCEANLDIRLGDARLILERELQHGDARTYDVLVADAFSSDSIPMHLLTLEAMDIYRQRLANDGVLAVHTSNKFLQLANVVRALASHLGLYTVYVYDGTERSGFRDSSWVLVTPDPDFVAMMEIEGFSSDWPDQELTAFWTDDFASVIPLVKWNTGRGWWDEFLIDMEWKKPEND